MDLQAMIDRVEERAAVFERERASEILFATMYALGDRIRHDDARRLQLHLPEPLASALASGGAAADAGVESFFADVAWRSSADASAGREQATAACEVIAEAVDDDALAMLRSALPPSIRPLLVRREHAPAPPHAHRSTTYGHTHVEAHAESVVRAENPHAARKLSSARGTGTAR